MKTARGDIEYLDVGEGLPILYFHGTGAGADVVPPFEQPLLDEGCRLIVPNRPGYYGTPLGDRRTATDCADLAVALLDELEIARVVAIGTSGGGPPAAAFADRHRERTAGLVMQCAQAHPWDDPQWMPDAHRWLYPLLSRRWLRPMLNVAHRTRSRFSPARLRSALEFYSGSRYPDLRNAPVAVELIETLVDSSSACARAPAGIDNDLEILFDTDAAIVRPEAIACPTLIIHDRADPVVPFAHVEWMREAIPHAEFSDRVLGGHLIWFGRESSSMHAERMTFLRRVMAS